MEALGYQNYDGRWYVRGETIPVKNEEEAADMVALRLAKRRPVPREMAPADEAQPLPEKDTADAKRTVPTLKRGKYLTRGPASASR
jgi:hypothetical protein